MPSLGTLPPELIRLIFKWMVNMNTLANPLRLSPLVATCRRFHQILTPMLYKDGILNTQFHNEKCLGRFFRTIRDNPALAYYVRSIIILGHGSTTSFEDSADGLERNWWEGEEWLKYALPRIEIRDRQRGGRREISQKWDTSALIALLLFRLKNVNFLYLQNEYWSDWKYLEKIYAKSLQNLEMMVFWPRQRSDERGTTACTINMAALRYLLSLPKLRLISGAAVNDQEEEEEDDDSEPFEYPCRNPFELDFVYSPLKPSTLRRIIAATPQLRKLQYAHLAGIDRNAPPFDCKKFVAALKPVRDTLEHLKLVDFDWHEEVVDVMPSLSSFTRLTHLEISPVFLCPTEDPVPELFEMLPSSLMFLVLSDMRTDYPARRDVYPIYATHSVLYARLNQYVEKKNIYALDLEFLGIFWVNKEDDEDAVIARRRLRKTCTNAAVDLKIDWC